MIFLFCYSSFYSYSLTFRDSSAAFTSLDPGTVYELYIYGLSLGIQNGSPSYFLSNTVNHQVPYWALYATQSPGYVSTTGNLSYQLAPGGIGLAYLSWSFTPSSLPTQTTLFEVSVTYDTSENGSYSNLIGNYFYYITGVSTENSPYNSPTSSITKQIDVTRGYWYKVEILSWNFHLNGLPYGNPLLEKKIYIP